MLWQFDETLKERKEKLISEGYDAYVLFSLQGQELNIADELNNNYDYLIATPITKMSHRSRKGVKFDVQEVLLGGYIFVYMEKNREIHRIKSSKNYFRVLSYKNDEGRLYGGDLKYANWVLEVEGTISVSDAIMLNGKVKIVNGPLKNLEGYIVQYSRRNRNCQIEIELLGQKINTWLPFDWIDADMADLTLKN